MRFKAVASTATFIVLASLVLFAAPASASKVHFPLGEFGTVAHPSFASVVGLAIDQSSGDLLVIDAARQGISRWNPDGTPANFSALGTNLIDGAGSGKCSTVPADCDQTPQNGLVFSTAGTGEQQVTVDNSGTVTDGDIYVTQAHAGLVDIFASSGEYLGQISAAGSCGVAVDSTGDLYVASASEGKIDKFDPSANPPVNADSVATFTSVAGPCNLAAGAGPTAGSLFANTFYDGATSKVDSSSGALSYSLDPTTSLLVSVDPVSGHVYSFHMDINKPEPHEVREYNATGATGASLFSTFTVSSSTSGLAIRGSTGEVYVGEETFSGLVKLKVYGPAVTVPDVSTGVATITGDRSATLNGTVNPDGVTVEECRFEYGLTEAYGQSAPCAETAAEIGTGTAPKAVHADIAGLAIESVYHVRLVAKNANATIDGPDQTFQTPTKPAIGEEWAASVSSTEASLRATINPGNTATTFRVEWGADASYGHSTAEIAAGADASVETVSAVLGGLAPDTSYHWRAVATNSLGVVAGPDRSFRTYPESASGLPDGRVYELVSPLVKEGGEVAVPGAAGGIAQASVQPLQSSPSGDAITYGSFTAFGPSPKSSPATSQYLSRRGPGGWSTENITPPFEEGGLRDPLVGFSEDLSHGAVIGFDPELTEDAAKARPNLYQRDNMTETLVAITTEANQAGLPSACISYGGASADSRTVIFANGPGLYEWSATAGVRQLNVLPDESVATGEASFGVNDLRHQCVINGIAVSVLRHAISADGSRVFWTYGGAYAGTYAGAVEPLFARLNGSETIQLDAPNEGVSGKGGQGRYWDASVDGSKVFFTDTKKLTTKPTTFGSADLYLYDFDAPEGERLTDLSADKDEAADVQGVVGASADGSYVYFVAKGVLDPTPNAAGESATPGGLNLYAWHLGESPRFVALLAEGDQGDWSANPEEQTARVSSDGLHLAFLSTRRLTGFDNTRANGASCVSAGGVGSGSRQCTEVFLYGFNGADLACASCNRASTRPLGEATVPTWSVPYVQPRYLSADGDRLFFETFDALDPRDVNQKRDVYEFELPGTGGCAAGAPGFNPVSGGCVQLISTGASEDESYFLDASSDGSDAFFSTRQGLVFSDEDGRFDVYDARVGGSSPEPPLPSCEGEACRGPATGPPAGISPATGTFQGPGDPAPKRGCPKGRRKIHRGGKARCVKPKKKHARQHQKRAHHKRRIGQ